MEELKGQKATMVHQLKCQHALIPQFQEELRTLKEEKKQIKYSTGSQPSRQKGGGQREVVPVAAPSSMKTATAAKTNLLSPGAVQEKQDTG